MSSLYTRLKITLGKANADDAALAALESDDNVTITSESDIIFNPGKGEPDTGVILYPGGRCDSRAYAPLARPLASIGFRVIIPNMPLRLAVLDANRIEKIMAQNPGITRWVVGGHSMGGAMAAAWVYKNSGKAAGLFFLASYPSKMHAMPDSRLPTTMVYGSHDFITRKSEFDASHERLPDNTLYIEVAGGDHYQFGSFANAQVTATIDRDEQLAQTKAALISFLETLPANQSAAAERATKSDSDR